ncbi:GerW family sporulation protein [Clostridium magnum]|uniref:Putative spore protein YtfJ n=1 Tax=Clostridium magnum DSM 2767 TaxID=1121326 RepID=A0A161YT23_9CLOT|nr:GerW family sporulation protein [Clostridium magnum]KZL94242.1 putative spore protein YtfJ [Clostridium magnum DSM 2767]SHH91997.1 sporulation protein YtfJ [Clostridium magnum DSM 2767]
MDNHPIENLLKSTMENLKDMIDVNTIVGDAVESKDGSLIIPISKVSFGFISGGSEFNNGTGEKIESKYPFGGGSGAGITVKPVAFLVTKGDSIRLLSLDHQNTYDKIVDSVPQLMDYIKGMVACKDKKPDKDCEQKKDDIKEGCPVENLENDHTMTTDAR